MFKKLLSNLPFNPSLISKVAFYAKRLHRETALRRLGLAFLVLALGIQIFAAAVPSQPSIASSGNDVYPGGFRDQAHAVNACNANEYNFKTIINYFGVDCINLFAGSVRRIDYSEYGGQLYSMGRIPYGFANEVSVGIPGAGTYYMRPLTSWGAHCYNDGHNCEAITGTRADGTPFMLLLSCGNTTIAGPPSPTPPAPPPPPPPPPTPEKVVDCNALIMSVPNNARVRAGSDISVRGRATGQNVTSGDLVDMYYELLNGNGTVIARQEAKGIAFSGTMAQDDTPRIFSLPEPDNYTFRLAVRYDSSTKNARGNFTGECVKQVSAETQKPCEEAEDEEDILVCLILSKKASNLTQGIDDANGTTAQAGDIILYSLQVTNTSEDTPIRRFVVEENISDILEYADVIDFHGGVMDDNNIVRWPPMNIEPGATESQQLTIKVKDPVPQTPVAASDPGSFDLTMTNVYGNTVNIHLPPTVVKTTEQITTTTLPNTGPGETLAVAAATTVVVGYFFARTRLMAKELDIVRVDYASLGGGS